jgi:hypothetical protein
MLIFFEIFFVRGVILGDKNGFLIRNGGKLADFLARR